MTLLAGTWVHIAHLIFSGSLIGYTILLPPERQLLYGPVYRGASFRDTDGHNHNHHKVKWNTAMCIYSYVCLSVGIVCIERRCQFILLTWNLRSWPGIDRWWKVSLGCVSEDIRRFWSDPSCSTPSWSSLWPGTLVDPTSKRHPKIYLHHSTNIRRCRNDWHILLFVKYNKFM